MTRSIALQLFSKRKCWSFCPIAHDDLVVFIFCIETRRKARVKYLTEHIFNAFSSSVLRDFKLIITIWFSKPTLVVYSTSSFFFRQNISNWTIVFSHGLLRGILTLITLISRHYRNNTKVNVYSIIFTNLDFMLPCSQDSRCSFLYCSLTKGTLCCILFD